MPFIKKGGIAAAIQPAQAEVDAIHNTVVTNAKLSTARIPLPTSAKGRDFDAEARGKTRCALEEAWAQSPLLPMLVKDPNDRAELHTILDEIVTERMKRVFPNG